MKHQKDKILNKGNIYKILSNSLRIIKEYDGDDEFYFSDMEEDPQAGAMPPNAGLPGPPGPQGSGNPAKPHQRKGKKDPNAAIVSGSVVAINPGPEKSDGTPEKPWVNPEDIPPEPDSVRPKVPKIGKTPTPDAPKPAQKQPPVEKEKEKDPSTQQTAQAINQAGVWKKSDFIKISPGTKKPFKKLKNHEYEIESKEDQTKIILTGKISDDDMDKILGGEKVPIVITFTYYKNGKKVGTSTVKRDFDPMNEAQGQYLAAYNAAKNSKIKSVATPNAPDVIPGGN